MPLVRAAAEGSRPDPMVFTLEGWRNPRTSAYEREVIRAYNQAKQFEMVSLEEKRH
jgi:hypothetical protein